MKRILNTGKWLVLLLLAVPFNSCTDLEEEVFSELTPQNFPTTRTDIIAAFAGAYTRLYFMGQHNNYASFNQVASDELMIPTRGADWGDGGQWTRMHAHEFTPNEESFNNGWTVLYQGALTCNDIISLLNTDNARSLVSAEEADQFIGEMRALRAYFYWALLDAFGDVPLVTGDEEAVSAEPTATPRAEVFNFVVSELEEASRALPKEKSINTYGRFNYYAAQALLARILLNAEVYTGSARWSDAVAAADEVINSNVYSLTDDYFENFNATNDNGFEGTSENILTIPYNSLNAINFNLVQMTLHYSSQATFNLQASPWNGYCTVQEFYDSYDDDDKRKGVSGSTVPGNFLAGPQFEADGVTPITDGLAESNDPDGPQVVFTPEINEIKPNALRQAGARVYKYTFENGSAQEMNNDWVLLRYADVLLIKAEALYRQNAGDGMALMLVNQIRERAGLDDFDSLNDDNLLAERGREMFYENSRRQDLIRFGQYTGTWDFKPASDPSRQIFPIPQPQLNANPSLSQNPGY